MPARAPGWPRGRAGPPGPRGRRARPLSTPRRRRSQIRSAHTAPHLHQPPLCATDLGRAVAGRRCGVSASMTPTARHRTRPPSWCLRAELHDSGAAQRRWANGADRQEKFWVGNEKLNGNLEFCKYKAHAQRPSCSSARLSCPTFSSVPPADTPATQRGIGVKTQPSEQSHAQTIGVHRQRLSSSPPRSRR